MKRHDLDKLASLLRGLRTKNNKVLNDSTHTGATNATRTLALATGYDAALDDVQDKLWACLIADEPTLANNEASERRFNEIATPKD